MPAQVPLTLASLGEERFVSLTTFRKSGARVATTVWIAVDGDSLVVTTPAESGKVKRLRNDSRVELRPSSRGGSVDETQPLVPAAAEIVTDPATIERVTEIFKKKYGLEYRAFIGIERVVASGNRDRFILRITQ